MKELLFLVITLSCFQASFAQKLEKETRISEDKAPPKAIDFINNIEFKKKLKWYSEKTSGKRSYESKFKYRGGFYSVEFDTLGNVEDIEVLVKLKKLDNKHKKAIKRGVLKEFEKLKWIKIQKQFTGSKSELKQVFEGATESVELNYEVELEVKTKLGIWKMYEMLINPAGEILRMREIQLRPTDNLNY